MEFTYRHAAPTDETGWSGLFAEYRADQGFTPDPAAVAWTWKKVSDPFQELCSLYVVDTNNIPVGFAIYHPFPQPVTGTLGMQITDLYTTEQFRRQGVAEALLDFVNVIATCHNYTVVRWMAPAWNRGARSLAGTITDVGNRLVYDNAVNGLPACITTAA